MNRKTLSLVATAAAVASIFAVPGALAGPVLEWSTVVNNTVQFPGDTRNFNSYNQPSVNDAGLVVFRARTQGGQPGGEPSSGILTRDMSSAGNPIDPIAVRGSAVPQPNNTAATYNEFPSVPRIDASSSMIATRGQSQPVLQYQNGVGPDHDPAISDHHQGRHLGDLHQPERPAHDRNERAGQRHQHDLPGQP